ncbi:MAG: histidine--tRNA ligase [Rickettsiales bacterium]|jgi:histidyl-tRNA synthetase|nr:histidine--tRNA ligase [Rickettsiales bacterium]
MSKLAALRGFNDIIFTKGKDFQQVVDLASNSAKSYGYQIGHFPVLESTNIFKRTLGEASDVVSKEMYSFDDRHGDSLTLRPEFTAVIARSIISNSLFHDLPFKFFSYGPLFRYERPQKGRFRQFHQLNFENYSTNTKGCDIDIILLINHLFAELNIADKVTLEINNLGCDESRNNYIRALIAYLDQYKNDLSSDSQKRLITNPLRILDSKNEADKKILEEAPSLHDYQTDSSKEFFANIESALQFNKIDYQINPKLVRGLDYYNNFVFEFTTNLLGSQNAVFAGGRYDKLFEILGSKHKIHAVGAAGGIERIMELCEFSDKKLYDLTIIPMSDDFANEAIALAENLRKQNIACDILFAGGNLKKRLQKAETKSNNVIIFGEDEAKTQNYKIKNFASSKEVSVSSGQIKNFL